MLETEIESRLKYFSYYTELSEIMAYAAWPAGKIFRPKLIEALATDLGIPFKSYAPLACSVEFHHAYTLVHDDLPAMDNDQYRRGKLSTHAKFGEWKAILAGDALLIQSFLELQRLPIDKIPLLLKLLGWATGAKGLIAGQFFDLSHDKANGVKSVIRIHELKTARLIQVCTLGAYYLSTEKPQLEKTKRFLRLGEAIGVSFQLLDDLQELCAQEISPHEKTINPFIADFNLSLQCLEEELMRLRKILSTFNLNAVEEIMVKYFEKSFKNLKDSKEQLEIHLGTINSQKVLNLNYH